MSLESDRANTFDYVCLAILTYCFNVVAKSLKVRNQTDLSSSSFVSALVCITLNSSLSLYFLFCGMEIIVLLSYNYYEG